MDKRNSLTEGTLSNPHTVGFINDKYRPSYPPREEILAEILDRGGVFHFGDYDNISAILTLIRMGQLILVGDRNRSSSFSGVSLSVISATPDH